MTQITKENAELNAFVKKWENLIPCMYLDQKGLPTIGVGHLLWNRQNASERYRGVLDIHKKYRFKIKKEDEPEREATDEEVTREFDRLLDEAERVIQQAKALASQGPTLDVPGLKPGPLNVPGLSPRPRAPPAKNRAQARSLDGLLDVDRSARAPGLRSLVWGDPPQAERLRWPRRNETTAEG